MNSRPVTLSPTPELANRPSLATATSRDDLTIPWVTAHLLGYPLALIASLAAGYVVATTGAFLGHYVEVSELVALPLIAVLLALPGALVAVGVVSALVFGT